MEAVHERGWIMEEEVLEKCSKLIKAYKRLRVKEPTASSDYVISKVEEAGGVYIDTMKGNEFAKDMIGCVIYHIIKLETESNNK